jgi:hypothetical protein
VSSRFSSSLLGSIDRERQGEQTIGRSVSVVAISVRASRINNGTNQLVSEATLGSECRGVPGTTFSMTAKSSSKLIGFDT